MNKVSEICYHRMMHTIYEHELNRLSSEGFAESNMYISIKAKQEYCRKTINMQKTKITFQEYKNATIDYFRRKYRYPFDIDYIQNCICKYYQFDIAKLHLVNRKREIVQARQLAMYYSKQLTKKSLSIIGEKIGGKDHATVLHACRTIDNLVDTNKQVRKEAKEIKEIIIYNRYGL